MKIKRTCRLCGYVWYGSVAGGIAAGILKSFFAALVTTKTGGSYIDHAKFRDELRLCPNCGASDSYKTEYEKEEPKPAPKKIPEKKTTKPEPKKTEVAPEISEQKTEGEEKKEDPPVWFALLGITVYLLPIFLIVRCACSESPEKEKTAAEIAAEANINRIRAETREIKERNDKAAAAEKEQKEQEYKKTYGEELYYAESFYKMFKDKPIVMNNFYKGGPLPMQITGEILDMGTNSYGNYIDLYTDKVNMKDPYTGKVSREKVGDIRVFLADSEWNNKAIAKLKRRNIVDIGGLCYGQTEAFGIKTKVIIGNATILKINKELL